MNKLQSIIAYLCINYPYKGELSKARLTKLVYLADWFSALIDDHQMTDINWLFNHYGPYVDDVIDAANRNPYFNITWEQNMYSSDKCIIGFCGQFDENSLTFREKQILNFVIEKTKNLYFNDFIDYVYSTYPIDSRNRYSRLDLVSLAREYNTMK